MVKVDPWKQIMSLAAKIRAKAAQQRVDSTLGIASLVGISTGPMKKILNGAGGMSPRVTELLAKFLELPPTEVVALAQEQPALGKSEELPLVQREYEVAVLRAALMRIAVSYGVEKASAIQEVEENLYQARQEADNLVISRALSGVSTRLVMTLKRLPPADQGALEILVNALAQHDTEALKALHDLVGKSSPEPKSVVRAKTKSRGKSSARRGKSK